MGKNRLEEMLYIVERNRSYQKEQEKALGEVDIENANIEKSSKKVSPEDVQIVFFAAESAFRDTFIEMCQKRAILTCFDKAEHTLNFCLKYYKKIVIIDMDSPTDMDESIDLFTTMKTAFSDAQIFLCTNKNNSWSVQNLKAKGGILLKKPLFYKDIEKFVYEHVHKGRS